MKPTAPIPFHEALDAAEVRSLLPTTGKTSDLQQLEGSIKRKALFSATVQSVELLQKIDDAGNAIITGTGDLATQRLGIKNLLAEMGYAPDPEKAGGLQDLSSTPRINLQIETLVDTSHGYGWDMQGQQADVLYVYPAQELIRDFAPKGTERPWTSRWIKAGGKLIEGRMVALKSDPVWSRLGDPELFDDGLDNPYPPFAFNSGMGVRDIDRDEAVSLDLLDENEDVFPRDLGLNDTLKASPDVRDENLRSMLEGTGLGQFNADGVFEFTQEDAA